MAKVTKNMMPNCIFHEDRRSHAFWLDKYPMCEICYGNEDAYQFKKLAVKTQQALSERDADIDVWVGAANILRDKLHTVRKEKEEYQKIAHHENNEADKIRIELDEALERESALNAKVEELEKFIIEECISTMKLANMPISTRKIILKIKDKDDAD